MTLRSLMRVHEDVLRQGWALTTATEMGLDTAGTRDALAPALAPDPQVAGKLQAMDVVTYDRSGVHLMVGEAPLGTASGVAAGVSRCYLTAGAGDLVARTILQMVPVPLRQSAGRMSATFFRYSPGAKAEAHQDRFGDIVVIWVLGREGDGGESFLTGPGGGDEFRRELVPGEMLIFRDEMFLHGVTPVAGDGAWRDALIFITLRDGA